MPRMKWSAGERGKGDEEATDKKVLKKYEEDFPNIFVDVTKLRCALCDKLLDDCTCDNYPADGFVWS